jgi:hypothetical protein
VLSRVIKKKDHGNKTQPLKMLRYLNPGDYSVQVRNEIASLLSENKEVNVVKAENARVSYMRSEFARRYDTASIFRLMSLWDAALVYQEAVSPALPTLIYYKQAGQTEEDFKVYEVITTTIAGESPETTPAKFSEYNGRNPFVILKLVDLILYDLHSKYARRLMPQIVIDRYKEAVEWVQRVGDGLIDADLPVLDSGTLSESSDIRYNSHPAEDNRW